MNTPETLIGSATLADLAKAGMAEEIVIRKDEDGYSVHVRAGPMHAIVSTKRGTPKYTKTMEPLASLLSKMGIRTFGYEDLMQVAKAPRQENLFQGDGRRRGRPSAGKGMTRKSA